MEWDSRTVLAHRIAVHLAKLFNCLLLGAYVEVAKPLLPHWAGKSSVLSQ
jgi:hypothetical protein